MPDHNVPSAVREVLDISPSYYAIADFNGRLTFTNHAEWWLERLHPSFTDQVNEKLKQHVDLGKEFWSDEYMFRKKDGSYAYVFDKGYIIKNENGRPIRFIGGMVDITHVKENSDLE